MLEKHFVNRNTLLLDAEALTVKFLNFQTHENLAVTNQPKIQQRCQTLGYFTKKMQMEKRTVQTLIRPINPKTKDEAVSFPASGFATLSRLGGERGRFRTGAMTYDPFIYFYLICLPN